MKWKTKEGKLIEVKDMSTSHIKNSLAMLKRKGFIAQSTLKSYLFCPSPRGDMAQYCFDQEFDRILNCPVSSFIDKFESELIKRNKE